MALLLVSALALVSAATAQLVTTTPPSCWADPIPVVPFRTNVGALPGRRPPPPPPRCCLRAHLPSPSPAAGGMLLAPPALLVAVLPVAALDIHAPNPPCPPPLHLTLTSNPPRTNNTYTDGSVQSPVAAIYDSFEWGNRAVPIKNDAPNDLSGFLCTSSLQGLTQPSCPPYAGAGSAAG